MTNRLLTGGESMNRGNSILIEQRAHREGSQNHLSIRGKEAMGSLGIAYWWRHLPGQRPPSVLGSLLPLCSGTTLRPVADIRLVGPVHQRRRRNTAFVTEPHDVPTRRRRQVERLRKDELVYPAIYLPFDGIRVPERLERPDRHTACLYL